MMHHAAFSNAYEPTDDHSLQVGSADARNMLAANSFLSSSIASLRLSSLAKKRVGANDLSISFPNDQALREEAGA